MDEKTPTNHHIKSNTAVDALVEAHADYHGFDNYSAAFRSIVLEWARMKATLAADQTPTTPTKSARKASA